ncbi:MAG: amino acid permease [Gemmatimonadaceae bacterium]|nr:amino acid permease [Gemmatimonadaceae bacterium]
MNSLFARKPIAAPAGEGDGGHGLRRTLVTKDLVALSIGAVIGAGIFSTLGTAAAGEVSPTGEVVRYAAGPALVISFVLLGAACALAALCYAELAAMIPTAGSAYAYSYASFGELVAWIIGFDLILEYAVGNVAVAISWSSYFTSLISPLVDLPGWLTHGYFQVKASSNPAIHAILDTAPRIGGLPIILNLPAFLIVMAITWLLVIGVRESARVNNVMVLVKLAVLALFVIVGAMHIDPANYTPFAPNGFRGIHQGAAIVFFAYIGFDAISTAAEEVKDPQRTMPRGLMLGLGICTLIYVIVGAVATGLVPYQQLASSDPLAHAFDVAGLQRFEWIISAGAVVSMAAVLLVFQYGQPRIFFSMARDGLLPAAAAKLHPKYRTPHITTIITGLMVGLAALVADDVATYDLTNIGTLFAFVIVCIGVLILRYVEPDRPRPFRVPFVWLVAPLGAAACVFVMKGLPPVAWERFGIWLAIGVVAYLLYGRRHSRLRRGLPPVDFDEG